MGMKMSGIVLRVEGGDKAQKTLDEVSSAARKNNAELQKLDAAYGKGSKEAEYLAQKSALLAQQLEQQKRATQALRDTREKYAATEGANAAQLEKLDMQILRSETSEARLERGVRECNTALEAQKQAAQTAAEGVKAAEDAARAGAKSWDEYATSLEKTGQRLEKAGRSISRYLSLPVLGMGVTAGKLAVDLEDSLYEVATLPGVLEGTQAERQKQLEAYRAAILDASNLSNTDANDLAAAQYQAISAGISPADSVYWAQRAAIAAKGGRSDAETVVSGASSVYNAWKSKSGGLDHILDVMMTAQNRGKTDVGQLASQVGQITGLAPQLGVGMEEVFASIAAMTLGGMSTSGSVTGLKAVMSSVIKPTAEAKEEAQRLGLAFDAAALQAQGLTGFLQEVADKTGMDVDSLGKLFGSVEGLNQVLALGTTAAADYASILEEMKGAAGVVDDAFETRVSSRAEKLAGGMNRLKNAGAELGAALLPAVDMGAALLENVSGAIAGMDEGSQKAVIALGAAVAAAGPALKISGALLGNIRSIAAVLTNPYAAIAAGAVGIGALTWQLLTANDTARNLEDALGALDMSVSPESKAVIARGIEAGIEEANRTFDAYARVQLDNGDELGGQLSELTSKTLGDAMITFGELQQWQELIDTTLNPLIEAQKTVGGKAGELAVDLQTAVGDLGSLLDVVYRAGNNATAQEISDLETAIDRVKTLAAEMLGLRADIDATDLALQGKAGKAVAGGYGDMETVAQAAGFVAQTARMREESIAGALDAAREAAVEVTGSNTTSEAEKEAAAASLSRARADAEAARAKTQADMTAELSAQMQGWIDTPGNGKGVEDLRRRGEMLQVLSTLRYMMDNPQDDLVGRLRESLPKGAMSRLGLGYLEGTDGLWDAESMTAGGDILAAYDKITAMWKDELQQNGLKDNPIAQMVQAWIDAGIDVNLLDMGSMPEEFSAALMLMMADSDPESIGTEAMQAIARGMQSAANDPAVQGTAREAMLNLLSSWNNAQGAARNGVNQLALMGILPEARALQGLGRILKGQYDGSLVDGLRAVIPSGMLQDIGYANLADESGLWNADDSRLMTNALAVYDRLRERLMQAAGREGMDDNPIAQTLLEWIQSGADPDAIDISSIAQELGQKAVDGLSQGIQEGVNDAEKTTEDASGRLGDALSNLGNTRGAGESAVNALTLGMMSRMGGAVSAADLIARSVGSALGSVSPGSGLNLPGAATQNIGSVDNSVNVSIAQAEMRTDADVNNLAGKIATYMRGKLWGLGIN